MSNRVARRYGVVFLIAALAVAAPAEEKKKASIPSAILQAQSVAVIIYPGSEVPLASPGENRKAVAGVESALMRWGRYTLADARDADLIIAVRKGRRAGPVLSGGDTPVILNPSDAGIHVGIHTGTPPGPLPGQTDRRPRVTESAGPAEDTLFIYRGTRNSADDRDPFDMPPLWQFRGKNALDAPAVQAVAALRKAVTEAEKPKP